MTRKSSITQLPPEIREELDKLLREDRFTIEQVVLHLQSLGANVSRSAVGRYHKRFDEIGKRMRESREIAAVWAQKIGSEPQGDIGRVVMEMLRTLAFDVTLDLTEEDGETGQAKALAQPGAIGALALAMQRLESATKTSFERELKARKVALEEAAKVVEKIASKGGMSAKTRDEIKAGILGISAKGKGA